MPRRVRGPDADFELRSHCAIAVWSSPVFVDGWPLGSNGLSDCSRFERGGADLDDSTSGGGADWRKRLCNQRLQCGPRRACASGRG
jgi:hypothetical protein